MDLRINSKSHVPVHVQLEEQIKHLILSGGFEVGSRLPSIRELAGYLRINRNTVSRVMAALEREGYVQSRRGSGVYVLAPPADAEDLKRQETLEQVIKLAAEREVPLEDLGYAILARAGVSSVPARALLLFAECNEFEVERFRAELEQRLQVEAEGVLLDQLQERVFAETEPPWRLAVTTFYHVDEVKRVMEPLGIETVALLTEATVEGLMRLSELPEGTEVGVVGSCQTCTDNLLRSLEGAGLSHLNFFEILEGEGANDSSLIENADVIVHGPTASQRLDQLNLPEGVEVVVQDRTLSQGGIEMLSQMLNH